MRRRFRAGFVLVGWVLLFSGIVWAEVDVEIPREYGQIVEVFDGRDGRRVFLIRDAHCHYEAQTNIAEILKVLISDYGVKLVCVEGAQGEIDVSFFASFPDAEIRREVADYFMRQGELTGAEFLAITENLPIALYGVEDKGLYLRNLDLFKRCLGHRDEVKGYLQSLWQVADELKGRIYGEELRELEAKEKAFDNREIPLSEYCRYLKRKLKAGSRRLGLGRRVRQWWQKRGSKTEEEFANFSRFVAALEMEEQTKDYTEAEAQYADFMERIDKPALFAEIGQVEDAIRERLYVNSTQRRLGKLSKSLTILEKLFENKATNEEFLYYQAHKEDFQTKGFVDFLADQAAKYGISFAADSGLARIDDYLPLVDDFYEVAHQREQALAQNMVERMERDGYKIGVLICGGFHTQGVCELLRQKGISYCIIAPQITNPDAETPYLRVLLGKETPLEELLEGK